MVKRIRSTRAKLLPSAKADLLNIFSYIATRSQSIEIAQRFTQRLRAQCHHLASLPFEMGTSRPELGEKIRSSAFENYVIFFRYHENRLEILNILEGHLDIESRFRDSRNAPS